MEIWLDTVEVAQIERAKSFGLLDGVTTNPSLLAAAGKPAEEILEQLLNHFSGQIAVQVTLRDAFEMVEQGKDLRDFSSRIIVKIPATQEGLQAIERLAHLDIPIMATTIVEPLQAFLAAKAGAKYVAPYYSHLGDRALPICKAIQKMKLPAKLLVASLKTPDQVALCAEEGFDAVTVKGALFDACVQTPPQTLEHLKRFEESWKSAPPSHLL